MQFGRLHPLVRLRGYDPSPAGDRVSVNGSSAGGLLSTRVSPTAMAMRVVELIRQHGLDAGAHLTEQWVADELQISRTPARRALTYLTEIGLVERKNGSRAVLISELPRLLVEICGPYGIPYKME